MGNNFNYKGSFDCKETIKKVKKLPSDAWQEFTFRQDNYNPHRDTLTIPLLFNTNFSAEPLESKYFNIFKKDIDILKNIFTFYYGPGMLVRAILVNLPAQKAVPDHYDFGESLERSYRHHIALITNDQVFFNIEKDSINMKVGEIWEINNIKNHSVFNSGYIDRVHLIVDWDIGK